MKLNNAILSFLTLVVVAILMAGCGSITENNSNPPKISYPSEAWSSTYLTSAANLYFAKPQDKLAEYIGLAGFPLGIDDKYWLGTSPGYQFYDGHMGGFGDSLEIISETNGIYMMWAFDSLILAEVFEGWQGQIMTSPTQKTGIKLGSTIASFKSVFPDTVLAGTNEYNGNSYRTTFFVQDATNSVILNFNLNAMCDSSGIIKKMRVDRHR